MNMKSFMLKMDDGYELSINRWQPDTEEEIKGVIQLHHGLAEHSLRYDRFGSVLAENGWVLNAYDMRGHGRSAENAEKNGTGIFGKLADKKGFDRAVLDLKAVTDNLKNDFPGKKTILMGHSFGSFVSQGFIEEFGSSIDACILCGTAGPRPALVGAGSFFAHLITFFTGKNAIVPLLDKLAFGSYNAKIQNPRTEFDWLSANELNVDMYKMDNWCGFPLTASFFCSMLEGLNKIHKSKNIKKIPTDLPVFFIWGSDDPVGSYGASIKDLIKIYQTNGMKKIDFKEYPGDRHEILNENDKEKVENDIIEWVNKL